MDVLLLAATVGLTTYLPRRFILVAAGGGNRLPSAGQRRLVAVALGLSLTLFSLSLLELLLVPGSWLLWLESSDTATTTTTTSSRSTGSIDDMEANTTVAGRAAAYWTIAGAYRASLWSMAVLCTVLIPSATATQILLARQAAGIDHADHDEQKKRSFTASRERHWSIRLLYKLVAMACNVAFKVCYYALAPVGRAIRSWCSRRKEKTNLPVLAERGDEKRSLLGSYSAGNPIIRFVREPAFRRCAVLGSVGGTALAWAILIFISSFVIEPSHNHSTRLLLRAVSWLCAVGILLSTVLNGFGSISLPYSCLAGLFLAPVPPDAVANAEIELEKAKALLEERIKELKSGGGATLPSGGPQSKKSLWRNVVRRNFSDLGDQVSRRKTQLMTEIMFLETLIDEMSEDVEEMRYSQAMTAQARSSAGRIRSWIGVVFSVVLLVRLFSAMSSVWDQYISGVTLHRSAGGVDPVTRILSWLSGHHVVNNEDLHTLSQFISLLITAFLSFSQVRTFLRTATTVQRRVSNFYRRCYCKTRCSRVVPLYQSLGTSTPSEGNINTTMKQSSSALESANGEDTWFFSHLVSALMCCYCLACIVLTKMMLPFEYRSSFSAALNVGANENDLFTIRTYAVDVTYSVTAVISGAILAMILGIMRSNARRYGAMDNASLIQKCPSFLGTPTKSGAEP